MSQALSCNPHLHKWVLVLSNLAYLAPASVTLFKIYEGVIAPMDGAPLITLFGFITFFGSWSYHSCRADLAINTNTDPCQEQARAAQAKIQPCDHCPPNSMTWVNNIPGARKEDPLTFQLAHFVDYFLAEFTLLMVLIHVLPISCKARKLIMVFCMVWIIMFLSGGNEAFALLPSLLFVCIMIVFWAFTSRHQVDNGQFYTRNKAWTLATLSVILATVFFKFDGEPYWLKHSLWHIFGGLSAALLLSKSASGYEDINKKDMQLPRFLARVLKSVDD